MTCTYGPKCRQEGDFGGERAKRFTDWCLYCRGFNHRAADCAARKKAQTFKAAGADVKEVGTKEGSKESGND